MNFFAKIFQEAATAIAQHAESNPQTPGLAQAAGDARTAAVSLESAGVAIVKEAGDAALAKLPFGPEAGDLFNGFVDDLIAHLQARKAPIAAASTPA